MKSNGALACILLVFLASAESRAAETEVQSEPQVACPGCLLDSTDSHSKDQDSIITEKYLVGGIVDKDVHNYKYTQLAEESFVKYKKEVGATEDHQITIVKASEQVVAGVITRLDYEAKLISSGTELLCHSETLEQAWQNVKEIKVNCKNQGPIGKAVIPGGIADKDVHDYKYTQLAEEAFVKYKKEVGATEDHQITIVQASEQVVAGMLTRLDFKVILMSSKTELLCHSEILEQPWLNVKDIKTSCDSESQSHTEEEQGPGGIIEKDVHDHKYTQLAEEAFVKYKKEVGSTEVHQILQIKKVTEQHVAGVNTRMDFYAKLITSNAVLFCHSEILEQPWLDSKNIEISCYSQNQDPKEETQIPGGIIEKDVNDNKYTQLAEEAFAKYKKEIGSYECHQLLKILKVTEQVVAGFMTKVDFNVRLVLSNDTLFCSSTILEEPGVNQKRIDTICHSVNQEQK